MAEIPQEMFNFKIESTTSNASTLPMSINRNLSKVLVISLSCSIGFVFLILFSLVFFFIKFKPHQRLGNRCNSYRDRIYNGQIKFFYHFLKYLLKYLKISGNLIENGAFSHELYETPKTLTSTTAHITSLISSSTASPSANISTGIVPNESSERSGILTKMTPSIDLQSPTDGMASNANDSFLSASSTNENLQRKSTRNQTKTKKFSSAENK